MNYKMIVAICNGNGIGNTNSIPWYSPVDLKHFSKLTKTTINKDDMNAIIMGRKTWDSIPKKPLPKRFHIILTKKPELIDLTEKKYENCIALTSTDEVERFCIEKNFANSWIIGGQSIYKEFMPLANKLLITEIDIVVEKPDTFFPAWNKEDWIENSRIKSEENGIKYSFVEYLRD